MQLSSLPQYSAVWICICVHQLVVYILDVHIEGITQSSAWGTAENRVENTSGEVQHSRDAVQFLTKQNKPIFENSLNCCIFTVYVSYGADVWLVERKKLGVQWRSRRLHAGICFFQVPPHTHLKYVSLCVSQLVQTISGRRVNKELDPLIMLI